MTKGKTPPEHNVKVVEAVILEVAAELHPENLSAGGLSLRIVRDPDDSREVETAARAIRGLREFGLLKDRDDELVEPTQAALRVFDLLTR